MVTILKSVIQIAPLIDQRFRLIDEHPTHLKKASFHHDKGLVELAKQCGTDVGLNLKDGGYVVWTLPNFETAPDIQFIKECGAMASGASTVPEQMAASLLGVRCIAFATVSNPATGTIEDYVHDQYSILELGQKCIVNLKKTLWKLI